MANHVVLDDAAIQRLLRSPDGPVAKAILSATIRVEAKAKRLLSQRGTGRVYQRSNPRRVHQASAPGKPPAVDTGLLRASVGRDLGIDDKGLVGRVGTTLEYARYLELGTTRMAPRPFLRPALAAANPRRVT